MGPKLVEHPDEVSKAPEDPIVEKKQPAVVELSAQDQLIRQALHAFAETLLNVTEALIDHADPTGVHHQNLIIARTRMQSLVGALNTDE